MDQHQGNSFKKPAPPSRSAPLPKFSVLKDSELDFRQSPEELVPQLFEYQPEPLQCQSNSAYEYPEANQYVSSFSVGQSYQNADYYTIELPAIEQPQNIIYIEQPRAQLNMHREPFRPSKDSKDAEVIAAAASAVKHQKQDRPHIFTKPSPRSASVKQMQSGKQMSQDRKTYLTSSENEDGDDSSERSADESDRGDEVVSPVTGIVPTPIDSSGDESRTSRKKKKKKDDIKRKRSSRSPSSERSHKRRSDKSSSHTKYSKSSLPNIHPSATVNSPAPKSKSSLPNIHPSATVNSPAPPVTPEKRAAPRRNLNAQEDVNNTLFETIMRRKSAQQSAPPDPDTLSKATSVKSRGNNSVRLDPWDLTGIEKQLPEGLRDNDVYKMTIVKMRESNTPRKVLANELSYIRFYEPSECDPKSNSRYSPEIANQKYLFTSGSVNFGHEFAMMESQKEFAKMSLTPAMRMMNKVEHSLDLVFRSVLKEISEELSSLNMNTTKITIENPYFVSGRYLELRLLEKIQRYYKENLQEDIVKYMTASCPLENAVLKPLVTGSGCEMYIRRLFDSYQVTTKNFENILNERPIIPSVMRVWTDVESQVCTNVMITNAINTIYDHLSVQFKDMSAEEKKREMPEKFRSAYVDGMKPFFQAHATLLAELMKRSELMAWMCFGVTTDDVNQGTSAMALSYYLTRAKRNLTNSRIVWNYPLAGLYKERQSAATVVPLDFKLDEEWTAALEVSDTDE